MAERYSKYSMRYSRNSSRKRSRDDTKYHSNESNTPPLPERRSSIQELIKQRQSIQKELKNISKHKSEVDNNITESYKKRKTDKHHKGRSKSSNDKHSSEYIKSKKASSDKLNIKDPSPEYSQDYTQLDSEDEEYIIEQRRKQRKELIEQLYTSEEKLNNITPRNVTNENSKDLNLNKTQNEVNKKQNAAKDMTDMFSEEDFAPNTNSDNVTQDNRKESSQLNDNWDDDEGYYNIKVGDIINNNRYTIKALVGQGVFANVVKAQDNSKGSTEVAIKIIRNNDLMYKTGLKEVELLKYINDADPENKYHCVKFYSNFMHKGHLCLVLEPLHMDLRSVIKKYGKNHGINMKALISYSRQLLLSLRLLKKIGIVHADIKPDNILVNEKKNVLKLCDFGSATKINDNEPTPYLVSRFYRAPEIILGISYKHSVDVWSAACTMYEMSTGRILFTGSSNNKMLKCFMDLKGKIPSRILRKGRFKDQHFNYNNNFLLHKKDEFTGREKVIEITNLTSTRDLNKELKKSFPNPTNNEEKKMAQLKDLLDKMLILDSNQRFSATDCLKHPFIQEEFQK